MFFVSKDKIGTTLGTQKEFSAAARRGIRFFSVPATGETPENATWHYLWPTEMVEPSLRAPFETDANRPAPNAYVWSQDVTEGDLVGEPFVRPLPEDCPDWAEFAKESFAAHRANAAPRLFGEMADQRAAS